MDLEEDVGEVPTKMGLAAEELSALVPTKAMSAQRTLNVTKWIAKTLNRV